MNTSRKDKCEPFEGKLFTGGYALVYSGYEEFIGKMVMLISEDEYGFWQCVDGGGDLIILDPRDLMPVSKEGWDNKTGLDIFIYQARYGL